MKSEDTSSCRSKSVAPNDRGQRRIMLSKASVTDFDNNDCFERRDVLKLMMMMMMTRPSKSRLARRIVRGLSHRKTRNGSGHDITNLE